MRTRRGSCRAVTMFPFSLITSQNLPFSKHKTRKARGDWQPAPARPSAMCCHGRFPPRKPGACGLACACVCLPACLSACLSETPTQQQSKPESQFISEGLNIRSFLKAQTSKMFITFPSRRPDSLTAFLEHGPRRERESIFWEDFPGPAEAQ